MLKSSWAAVPGPCWRCTGLARRLAGLRGRSYVIPDDVKYLAPFVLEHRIIAKAQSHLRGSTPADIIKEVLESVKVPVEDVALPEKSLREEPGG